MQLVESTVLCSLKWYFGSSMRSQHIPPVGIKGSSASE
ncbi:hypothetical protein VH1709_contig00155-0014 [Vibrio harveyi]|nr:hypothetical protein VH1709_contig00155-0014 [Vibrio harveyi]